MDKMDRNISIALSPLEYLIVMLMLRDEEDSCEKATRTCRLQIVACRRSFFFSKILALNSKIVSLVSNALNLDDLTWNNLGELCSIGLN